MPQSAEAEHAQEPVSKNKNCVNVGLSKNDNETMKSPARPELSLQLLKGRIF